MSVLFAVMPFVQIAQPSLACQLLASTLRESGIPSRVHYYTLDFAERIGVDLFGGEQLTANRDDRGVQGTRGYAVNHAGIHHMQTRRTR